jgi:hypothetical protein
MPRPFVLRLRDIRQRQLEARNKAEERQMTNISNNQSPVMPNISREDMEEFMEEAL